MTSRLQIAARRARRAVRAQRLGQDDAAEADRRAAAPRQRLGASSTAARSRGAPRPRVRATGCASSATSSRASDLLEGASAAQNAAFKLWLTEDARAAERIVEPLLVRLGLGERLAQPPARALDGRAPAGDDRAGAVDRAEASCSPMSRPGASTRARGREVLELLARPAASAAPPSCWSPTIRRRRRSPTACTPARRPPGGPHRRRASHRPVDRRSRPLAMRLSSIAASLPRPAESPARPRTGAARRARAGCRRRAAVRLPGREREPERLGRTADARARRADAAPTRRARPRRL